MRGVKQATYSEIAHFTEISNASIHYLKENDIPKISNGAVMRTHKQLSAIG
jgi:hypothetical protein